MMAAKVGTGIVAELGSMRISDEIDALEVMGITR
jgi:phospholipid/cholesterol/gamma-HCH transport system permease protein